MRRFIQSAKMLSETIDPELTQAIENQLRAVNPEQREAVFDALMVIRKYRGAENGVTPAQIYSVLDRFYDNGGKSGEDELGHPDYAAILELVVRYFSGEFVVVTRDDGGEPRYHWVDEADEQPSKPTPDHAQEQQILADMLARAKRMESFTVGGLARMAMGHGVDRELAAQLARQFVQQHLQELNVLDDEGTAFRFNTPRAGAMDTIRDAAARAAKNNRTDV